MAATYPDMGDFPFTAGDTITYTMNACNDGEGGMDVDISMTIE